MRLSAKNYIDVSLIRGPQTENIHNNPTQQETTCGRGPCASDKHDPLPPES